MCVCVCVCFLPYFLLVLLQTNSQNNSVAKYKDCWLASSKGLYSSLCLSTQNCLSNLNPMQVKETDKSSTPRQEFKEAVGAWVCYQPLVVWTLSLFPTTVLEYTSRFPLFLLLQTGDDDDHDEVLLNVLRFRLTDILGTRWDQCRSMVQYIFMSMEARRLVRTDSPGRPPRLSHSSWTMMQTESLGWAIHRPVPDPSLSPVHNAL